MYRRRTGHVNVHSSALTCENEKVAASGVSLSSPSEVTRNILLSDSRLNTSWYSRLAFLSVVTVYRVFTPCCCATRASTELLKTIDAVKADPSVQFVIDPPALSGPLAFTIRTQATLHLS